MWRLILVVLNVIFGRNWTTGSKSESKDFCQFDSFYGRCSENEVITIESAFYGRMKVGKCISGEGYVGCGTDVRPFMDSACAGRHQCNVTVTSLTEVVQPCRKDFTSYLEVAYACKEVFTDSHHLCRSSSSSSSSSSHRSQGQRGYELTIPSGLLSSVVTAETDAGSPLCPWQIRAQPGQQVRLKLIVYRAGQGQGQGQDQAPCPWSIVVDEEGEDGLMETLCGRLKAQKELTVSKRNLVRVQVKLEGRPEEAPIFVIQYEVIGCPDIVASQSSGTLVTRTGEELVVRCRESRETWYLTCSGSSWIGDFENCSTTSHRSSQKSSVSSSGGTTAGIPFPQGLVIAVILGLILGLFVGSASLAALFIFRRRRHLANGGRQEDDDYATEKLRATDCDPEGYRSTISGYQLGATTMTSPGGDHPTVDFPRPHRCLGFYSGGGGGRPLVGSGRVPVECLSSIGGSPMRNFAVPVDVPCGRLHSLIYETTRLGGGCGGGGGVGGGGVPQTPGAHDSPKIFTEDITDVKKTGFPALAT